MLWTTNDKVLSTQATKNKRNKAVLAGGSGDGAGDGVDRCIKNLSIIANLAKSKKAKLTKLKKSDLLNAKANFGTDFLTPKTKKVFIHLWNAFIEALILRHFDPKRHIWIETDASGYAIGGVLSQLTSNQLLSNHVTYKNHF